MKNSKVESNAGRFGPYIKHDNKFVSLPKGISPLEVSLEQAIELIKRKEKLMLLLQNTKVTILVRVKEDLVLL